MRKHESGFTITPPTRLLEEKLKTLPIFLLRICLFYGQKKGSKLLHNYQKLIYGTNIVRERTTYVFEERRFFGVTLIVQDFVMS